MRSCMLSDDLLQHDRRDFFSLYHEVIDHSRADTTKENMHLLTKNNSITLRTGIAINFN